jgi:ribosome-binding protein aMBF1 (putative translation factor)
MRPKLNDELNRALDEHHGFLKVEGQQGDAVVMSMQLFREMLGVGSDEQLAKSVQAIVEALADVEAGRTMPMDDVFRELDEKYGIQR